EVKTFSAADVRQLYDITKHNELVEVSLLLFANCGFTQSDVSELRRSEIADGRIIRKRSKTRKHENCPTVNYKLWPITWQALQREIGKHKHQELAVVDANGNPLKSVTLTKGKKRDKLSKTDRIR